jgi:hypothetical protein
MLALLLPAILGAAALIAAVAAVRWFVAADPAKLARIARNGGSAAMVVVGVLLVLRGQAGLGMSLAAAGFGRMATQRGSAPGFGTVNGGRGQAQRSSVRTALLDATLDHATGAIDAVVRGGRFAGRQLSAMTKAEVLGLWVDCGGDADSRSVVEAYLDRRHPEWRRDVEGDAHAGPAGAGRAGGTDRRGPMTKERAYEVLGVPPGAPEAEIRQAHRRLMKAVHPDQGGDGARAAEINEARDVLLSRRRR